MRATSSMWKVLLFTVVLAVAALSLYLLLSWGSGAKQPVLLTGSGATFPQEQVNKWVIAFSRKYPGIKIEYAGGGSGKGLSDFLQGVVDFACSDVPLKTDDWERAKSLYGKVYQLPWVAGGIAIIYNVPEAGNVTLRLTQNVLVDILLGRIEHWDDPRIADLNPSVKLPHAKIIFVHRSDASGTTYVFTRFLSKISAEWRDRIGSGLTVQWPLDRIGRGIGAQGNPGVAQTVRNTPYSLGYVELAYARGLGVFALENAVGEFVTPSLESVLRAVESASVSFDPSGDVSSVDILDKTLNVRVSGAYPIVSVSYVIVKFRDAYPPEKAEALSLFLKWVFTEGQERVNIAEGYAPIGKVFRDVGIAVAESLAKP
ncbi:phosphate ABC transporter substrate-binding protein PstS [Infirmifilum lucidum]|uniref:Phosphate-binding protein n=1 Tax=Infirmifilum lucidum TaxID=2776706 RepID=A0A7L9FKK7_9CREN|nr:phosphate ABC transporter substrate-binding protein PstS [Infirmifilum lucidum]QOJ79345.1 phosphate ABC transporter substrate-binding protein PstS [Infirmifilum lucidum]